MSTKRFRVAFSFAGEKRYFVAKVAAILAKRFGEEAILYDKYHEAEFARHDLGIYLPKLYGEQSDLIVPVLCRDYDPKRWTGWEWLHIYGLLTKADGYRVMPSRFEHANADGLSPAAGFIELDDKTPEEAATLILERLALNEGKPKKHYLHSTPLAKHSGRDIVYISYSHKDKVWHRKLRRVLDADPEIRDLVWDDTKIPSSVPFAKAIDDHVARARIMIMLGSEDYFREDSGAAPCETGPALAAHNKGEMDILWFPVRTFDYRKSPVGHIMAATGAGAAPLESLSVSDQKRELHRVRKEVRRCLGIAVPALGKARSKVKSVDPSATRRPLQQTITSIEFTLDQPLANFDPEAFRAALRNHTGLDVSGVRIASIRSGSTRVEIVGNSAELHGVVTSLKDSQERLHNFAVATRLTRLAWVMDGITYELRVTPNTDSQLIGIPQDFQHHAQPHLITRTIVELDLMGYSDVARELEEHFSADLVMRFNEQIQTFVTDALKIAGVLPRDAVMATTGDGAILMFDRPSVAHVFAEALQNASRLHNHKKTVAATQRWFRIGIATGGVAIEEAGGARKIAGSVIARAVRLEAAGSIGQIVVDAETYSGLSREQRACYGTEEQIAGKRHETFAARRYPVILGLVVATAEDRGGTTTTKSSGAIKKWQQKLDFLQEELAIAASPAQKFELKNQIDEAKAKIAELGG